jgi:hypothetical protein
MVVMPLLMQVNHLVLSLNLVCYYKGYSNKGVDIHKSLFQLIDVNEPNLETQLSTWMKIACKGY